MLAVIMYNISKKQMCPKLNYGVCQLFEKLFLLIGITLTLPNLVNQACSYLKKRKSPTPSYLAFIMLVVVVWLVPE